MHPAAIVVPALALLLGPRLWVAQVRKRHDRDELEGARSGGELARELLDQHGLRGVTVEPTDIGDHYDPLRKSVRLSRQSFERRSVAALVTAAHEVGHAIQDATGYPPFRWRSGLVRVARVTAEVGSVLLLAAPLTALLTRRAMPTITIGSTAFAVIGTGVIAQMAALPTEWDASFGRALPLLEAGHLEGAQVDDAREMLLACSLTYVAASLAAALQLWPWIPRSPVTVGAVAASAIAAGVTNGCAAAPSLVAPRRRVSRRSASKPVLHTLVRRIGKPLIRAWYLNGCGRPGAAARCKTKTAARSRQDR